MAKHLVEKKEEGADDNSDQQNSVASDDDIEEVVFVVDSTGIVRKKAVKTDIQDINYIEIKEGLKAGDNVITGPYDVVSKQLKDSTKVKVVTKDELSQSFKPNN
ncbi:MAG: hypothetical protein ABI921_11240 [Panacibacter sp.]